MASVGGAVNARSTKVGDFMPTWRELGTPTRTHERDGVRTAEIGDSTVRSHRSALAPTHARFCGPYGFARASAGVREERAILTLAEATVRGRLHVCS